MRADRASRVPGKGLARRITLLGGNMEDQPHDQGRVRLPGWFHLRCHTRATSGLKAEHRISNRNIRRLETHLTPAESACDSFVIATNDDLTKLGILSDKREPKDRIYSHDFRFSRSQRHFSRNCAGPNGARGYLFVFTPRGSLCLLQTYASVDDANQVVVQHASVTATGSEPLGLESSRRTKMRRNA